MIVTFTGVSSVEPSGYVTFTGISTSVPGVTSAGGVTDTFPSGSTVTVHPSGTRSFGISKFVPGGKSLSPVCGISTFWPGFVLPSSYPGVLSCASFEPGV